MGISNFETVCRIFGASIAQNVSVMESRNSKLETPNSKFERKPEASSN
jgi:hypothetical protein